jgi:hypothetical protein
MAQKITYSYLEIYIDSTKKWECFCLDINSKSGYTPFLESHFNLNSEFLCEVDNLVGLNSNDFALTYCFNYLVAFKNKNKQHLGIPADASKELFNEVEVCSKACFLYLYELLDFDYHKLFELSSLPKSELEKVNKNYDKSVLVNDKKSISFRNYLGLSFFKDLDYLQEKFDSHKIRLIYFLVDYPDELYEF